MEFVIFILGEFMSAVAPLLSQGFLIGFAAGFAIAISISLVRALVSMFRRIVGWTNIE